MNNPSERTAEEIMLLDYMDDVRDAALLKLTKLEIAALFNDFAEFRNEFENERDMSVFENYIYGER